MIAVYLRSTPEIVYERMLKRARSEESCVPLKYLQELHELHENWLIRRQNKTQVYAIYTNISFVHILKLFIMKVLVLDANLDLEHIGKEYKRSEYSIINASLQAQPQ